MSSVVKAMQSAIWPMVKPGAATPQLLMLPSDSASNNQSHTKKLLMMKSCLYTIRPNILSNFQMLEFLGILEDCW